MASLDVYTILLRCWLENPVARPDFKTLTDVFTKMLLDPKRYLSIEVNFLTHLAIVKKFDLKNLAEF